MEKLNKSRYFRISVTNMCNLNCYFCHNEGQNKKQFSDILAANDIIWVVGVAKKFGFKKFKLTGGEPTIRTDIVEIIAGINKLGVEDLSMITNGTNLNGLVKELKSAGLDRVNVSMFTLDKKRFKKNNCGQSDQLARIISGIDEAIKIGFKNIKLNYVWHNEYDFKDFLSILNFAKKRELTVVLLPIIEYNLRDSDKTTSLNSLYLMLKDKIGIKKEKLILDHEGIKKLLLTFKDDSQVLLRHDELKDRLPYSNCSTCPQRAKCREGIYPVRLSADGILKPCLSGTMGMSLLNPIKLRDEQKVMDSFKQLEIF